MEGEYFQILSEVHREKAAREKGECKLFLEKTSEVILNNL